MQKKSVRLFVVISLIIASIDAAFVYMNSRLSEAAFHENIAQESETLRFNFNTLLSQTYTNMLTVATYISSDTRVQQLFLKGVNAVKSEGGGAGGELAHKYRSELFELVGNNWKHVQENFNTRQLHFHIGPGSTSYLRVHKPQKYGDNMDNVRFTIVDTNREKTPRTGFETGRVYSGLRGVVPVTAIDPETGTEVHAGALEVGTSFKSVLKILDEHSNFGAGILLTKDHIKSAMWPDAIEKRFGGSLMKCDCVIESASREGFDKIVNAGRAKGIYYREAGNDILELDGRNILISYFPLRDYKAEQDPNREHSGAVLFWRDVSDQVALLKESHRYNIYYGIFGFITVELLFFIGFRLATLSLQQVINEDTKQLTTLKDRLASAQKVAHIGNYEWNLKTGDLWCSDELLHILKLNNADNLRTFDSLIDFIHPDDKSILQHAVEMSSRTGKPYSIEYRLFTADGSKIIVSENGEVAHEATEGDQDYPLLVCGTVRDITHERNTEKRLEEIIWATNVGTWIWDIQSGAIVCNERLAEILGYSLNELSPVNTQTSLSLVHPDDLKLTKDKLRRVLNQEEEHYECEARIRTKAGVWNWILLRGRLAEIGLDNKPLRMSGTMTDISGRKYRETEIQRLATTDSLTGLANRTVFNQKLDELLKASQRTQQPFAILMIDLDGFKPVNDQFGHPVGDQLLKHIAWELHSVCRESDVIARLGGDEFAVILPSVMEQPDCASLAERILQKVGKEKMVDGHLIHVSASIGSYIFQGGESADEIIKAADNALYKAKSSGKNCHCSQSKRTHISA